MGQPRLKQGAPEFRTEGGQRKVDSFGGEIASYILLCVININSGEAFCCTMDYGGGGEVI